MLNTTQAAALHAFNNSASQGRLTETSLARALKSEKVLARTTITALREKGMVTAAGKYEYRITDAGRKYLKSIGATVKATTAKAFVPANSAEAFASRQDAQQPADTQPAAPLQQAADTLVEHAAKATAEEVTDVDVALAELIEDGIVKVDGDKLQLNEPASSKALLDTELTALAELLDPDQFPVIDDIDCKQHALAGIAVLLKLRTPALANLAEQLATDLSVIRLHQERRA